MDIFCKNIPKVELHAHLSGSISDETVTKLYKGQKNEVSRCDGSESMDDCFKKFKAIQELTNNTEGLFQATIDVIKEFADDNVKYLELRSTLRHEPATGMSKEDYIETVLSAIRKCNNENDLDIVVKYLVSIDRSRGSKEAMENVAIACKYKQRDNNVVGIDLSGNPSAGKAADFVPALQEGKNKGLKLSLHLSESRESNVDTLEFLHLMPARIGHGTFLLPEDGGNEDFVTFIVENNIPIELCLTSNIKCQTVPSYDNHHFMYWFERKHPVVLCTDDKGVFTTSLSNEYNLVSKTFNLNYADLFALSENSIDWIFSDTNVKDFLHDKWASVKSVLLQEVVD